MPPLALETLAAAYPVLLVDDEPMNLSVFEYNFVPEFTLRLASNAEQALAVLASEPIAVIVADHRMPGMSGLDLLSTVRERHPHVVRILLTAHGDVPLLLDAINRGTLFRYVPKPWDEASMRQDLLLAIERHVADRDAAQQAPAGRWAGGAVAAAIAAALHAGVPASDLADAASRVAADYLRAPEAVTTGALVASLQRRLPDLACHVDDDSMRVWASVEPVLDVLVHLVDNARRSGATPCSVGLTVAAVGADRVRFTLRDGGPGLGAAAEGPPVPFAGAPGRTGLGLAVAHAVASNLGGALVREPGPPGRVHLELRRVQSVA